ncbi:SIMPL domain-containing protein [Idiomarina xiamenensis]|uniref:DUF541 domain-containing protein n=1 Tax=Idiomarina xiamenensis 10-D-4 TaxID=740709 RepID=K2KPF8_9GAMM|nr:SIMPL domain-containing protein [Idiomarina xiamenensis]EKE84299.1 hypothetical protein A10D4_06406 [Idiomarina xiamenensis 10-D-4]
MRKIMWLIPALLLSACQVQAQNSNAMNNTPSVTVSGQATHYAVPDQMSLTLWVEERGQKLSSLKTQVDQASEKVLRDLLERDIDKKDIQSYQLQVYPQYERNDNGETQQKGFVVQRQIRVTLRDTSHYDKIVDMALAQGVTRVANMQYEISNADAIYQQALTDAYAQAQQKAKLIAERAGLSLGHAINIREQSMPRYGVMMMAAERVSKSDVSLPGQQSVEAQIEVTFTLQ